MWEKAEGEKRGIFKKRGGGGSDRLKVTNEYGARV